MPQVATALCSLAAIKGLVLKSVYAAKERLQDQLVYKPYSLKNCSF